MHCPKHNLGIDLRTGASPTKRTFQMETTDRPMLLDAELEVFSHDRIYEEAVAACEQALRRAPSFLCVAVTGRSASRPRDPILKMSAEHFRDFVERDRS